MKVRRYIALGVIGGLALPAACVFHDYRLKSGFERISIGMSVSEVFVALGKPWRIEDCEGEFKPYQRPDCAQAFVYAAALAPLEPRYPVVWLNRDEVVIKKYEFFSP